MISTLRRLAVGTLFLALFASTAATASADSPVVPILTGGELHWAGSALRTYHGASDDEGISSTDDSTSAIAFDFRLLLEGHYADGPATPIPDPNQLQLIFPTDEKKPLGSGTETQSWSCDPGGDPDCSANLPNPNPQTCTWTESGNGASAAVWDSSTGRQYIVDATGADVRGNRMVDGHSSYTCADQYNLYDPSMFYDCRDIEPAQANACGTVVSLPEQPAEGDAATITRHFDHASATVDCHRSDNSESCAQTGSSDMTIKCALCVTDIHFQQPDLPGRSWTDVPATGTFDGNDVKVTATVHNATGHAITAPVRFRDLTTSKDLPTMAGGQTPTAQVSFPAGADTSVVLDWDTEGFAWYAPHTADPHKIAVLTPYGGARRDLGVRPKPVLLVHGFFSDSSTWAGYPARFGDVRGDWVARTADGMNTDPLHGNTIFQNGQILAGDIDSLRDELDAEHLDLVVHSMGGLISRSYLQYQAPDDPDQRPVVSHLVMLGTPNEGSACASRIMGVAWGASQVLGTDRGSKTFGRGEAAPSIELSPEYMNNVFNRLVSNTRGTKLSVLAGIAPAATQETFHLLCGLQKPNDKVVWKTSAFWTLSDTATQDGLVHTDMTSDGQAFSSFVVPHLEVTPDGPVAGARVAGAARVRAATAHAVAAKAKAKAPAAAAPNLALAQGVSLPAHATRRVRLPVRSGNEVAVMLLAPTGIQAQLVDPYGKAAATATAADALTGLSARARRHGIWTIVLRNGTARRAPFAVGAVIGGDRFVLSAKLKPAPHKRLGLSVAVRGGGRTTATAVVRSLDGTGNAVRVRLKRHGSGFRGALKPLPNGTAVFVVVKGRNGTRTTTVIAAAAGAPRAPKGA